ncbi:hypothetical protein [Methanoregula sp.]|uniref:hypothetical protein n=1 Tax=Methanoregula sp. TaxID=2052170 RepID=UPI003BB1CC4A
MNFPYVPPRWDIAPFIMGSICIAFGLHDSVIWLVYFGILLISFSFLIVGFFLIAFLDRIENASDRKQREFVMEYLIFGVIAMVIIALIFDYIYFGFDPRVTIDAYRANLTPLPSIDLPNIAMTWIRNLTHQ